MKAMKSFRFWIAAPLLAVYASGASANDELIKLSKDPNQWVMPAGNYANWRYSELNQINKDNVKNLRPLWTFSTGVLRGHEGGPLVIGDIMYIHTPFPNNVFALAQLNLVYYGSGNPSTWNPVQRPGDNKWSMTIFARNPDTGVAKWVFQMTPHDEWDYDGVNEMILADLNVKGQQTKALVHFDRNGFAYTLNRETGALLVAEKYDPKVNWATHVDMQTGKPQVVKQYSTQAGGEDHNTRQICPAALGSAP
jgi:glucose dehydrogenase